VQKDAVVMKYDLTNTTIPATDLIDAFGVGNNSDILNAKTELLNLLPVKSFTFTRGMMYCEILNGCRLDKIAFDQVIKQIEKY
jgi:hypothetical protein